jgi:hypothetical protein
MSGTGRDYNSLVDLFCLIPYTRSLWCKATVWIAFTVDTPERTFSYTRIPIRVSDFVIIFLLMLSYLELYHSRGNALPNPVVVVIPVTSRLKSFCGSLFGSLGRSKYLSIPVIFLAFAHITVLAAFHFATVPMMTPPTIDTVHRTGDLSNIRGGNVLDCWTAPCMSGRFYTEPQE